MIEDDTNLMNKYRINFYSLTCKHHAEAAKVDFIKFAKKIYPEQKQAIQDFEGDYKVNLPPEESVQQSLNWLAKNDFFLESTQALPKITADPKKLGYLRFPFKEISDAIMMNYKKKPKKVG